MVGRLAFSMLIIGLQSSNSIYNLAGNNAHFILLSPRHSCLSLTARQRSHTRLQLRSRPNARDLIVQQTKFVSKDPFTTQNVKTYLVKKSA
jgi:hypothetical protein